MTFENLKRLFSVITAAISFLFSTALPFSGNEITVNPTVFEYGADTYCVIWATSKKGTGFLRYTYDGTEKTIWDEELGIIRTDDTIHRVFVPKEELQDNDYCVGSQYVWFQYAAGACKGKTIESERFHFRGVAKEDDIRILCVSDIHQAESRLHQSVAQLTYTPDLIALLGDVTSWMETKTQFTERLLGNAAYLSGSEIPVVYAKGNHETRGEFGAQMARYLPLSTEGFYYTFDFGGLSAVVLDTVEYTDDHHEQFAGLSDFEAYRSKEWAWINTLRADDFTGKYKIVFTHIPGIQDNMGQNWAKPFANMGFDIVIGGHLHTCKSWNKNQIPIVSEGGVRDDDFWIGQLWLNNGIIDLQVTNMAGECVYSFTIDHGAYSEVYNF